MRMVVEFYDFEKVFKGPFVKREVTTDGKRMYFQPTSSFRYQKIKFGKVLVKSYYNEDAEFKVWDFLKGTKTKQKVQNNHLKTLLERLPTTTFIANKNKQGPPAPPRALLGLPAACFSTCGRNLTDMGSIICR